VKIEDCLFFALSGTARRAGKFWKQSVAELGITGVQGMVLKALGEEEPISSIQLGQKVQLDSATMTGILDRLEQSGLIQRMANVEDRRAVRITLTTPGKSVTEQLQHKSTEANRLYSQNLSAQELKTLKGLLAKL